MYIYIYRQVVSVSSDDVSIGRWLVFYLRSVNNEGHIRRSEVNEEEQEEERSINNCLLILIIIIVRRQITNIYAGIIADGIFPLQ